MDTTDPSNLQGQATDMAEKAVKTLGEKADCWLRKSRDCIEKHPLSCMVAAVAIGAVIGYVALSDHSAKAEK